MSARAAFWPLFFAGVLLAWAALWAMAAEPRALAAAGIDWAALCRAGAGAAPFPALAAMWAVMAAAMMAPAAAPALAAWAELPPPAGGAAGMAALAAGYLAVWAVAAVGFAAVQAGLARAGLVAADGRSLSPWLTAALLLAAGAWQLSALRAACLSRCRAPFALMLARWRPGLGVPFGIGLRLGRDCLACCWALMLLAAAGGMASLVWMGLATVLIVAEKLPRGRALTRPLGAALIAAGLVAAGIAAGGGA
jgi:predicted metal-binding membrane protein